MGTAIIIVVILMNSYLQITESKTIPTCTGYICGDGTCVNGTRCDGVVHCADGSDEIRCKRQSYCTSSQFRCSTSYSYYYPQCISSSRRCDGRSDCSDGSDERNCATNNCYYCRRYSSSYTLSCSKRCDGRSECYDGSDERNCRSGCYYCRKYSYSSSLTCSKRCDGRTECYDKSDEQGCDTDDSAFIGIIVGSSVGGLFIFICCPTTIIIIVACAVYHASKSGQRTITTTTVGAGATTAGAQSLQPGFQLQNLDIEKPPAQTTESDVEAVTSELTQQAPPPYTGIKPVLYLPNQK